MDQPRENIVACISGSRPKLVISGQTFAFVAVQRASRTGCSRHYVAALATRGGRPAQRLKACEKVLTSV